MSNSEELIKNLPPLIGLVVLVLVLLFVLVNFGLLRACDIPGFSGIYYAIKGTPTIAIVTGDDGIGDPDYLKKLIVQETKMFATEIPVDTIFDSSRLEKYQVVVVEHARTMSTQALWAFQNYVQKGGKLVWIGDAGSKLGSNDYICEKVTFTYKQAVTITSTDSEGNPTSQENCLDWVDYIPQTIDSKSGLCNDTFGGIVVKFYKENKTLYDNISKGSYHLCPSETNPYAISGADMILRCLSTVSDNGITDINGDQIDEINNLCKNYNYWKRGPSRTELGTAVDSLDFSALVLGADFLNTSIPTNLFLTPFEHILTRGYEGSMYFGVSNVSIIDTTRFSNVFRTSVVMSMKLWGKQYPAITVSNPLPSINRNGLIVYYAFPPEDPVKTESKGLTLIDNLFDFLLC